MAVPQVVGVSLVEKADFTATGTPTRAAKSFTRFPAGLLGTVCHRPVFRFWSPLQDSYLLAEEGWFHLHGSAEQSDLHIISSPRPRCSCLRTCSETTTTHTDIKINQIAEKTCSWR
jgi:hypothetical protein